MESRAVRVAVVCDYALDYVGGAQTALVEQARALAAAGCEVVVVAPSPAEAVRALGFEPLDPEHARDRGPAAAPAQAASGVLAPAPEQAAGGSRVLRAAQAASGGHAADPEPAAAGRAGARIAYAQVDARVVVPGVGLPLVRNSARLRARLRGIFRARDIDVVQLHSEFGVAAGAIEVARELRIPVVQTVHTFFWQTTARPQRLVAALVRGFHRWITGIEPTRTVLAEQPGDSALRDMTLAVARRVDRVVSPSAHQAERLRDAGLADVVVVPNTVTTGRGPGSVLDAAPGAPLRVLWIGRCEPEKRIVPFTRAVVAAQRELGPGRLRVAVVGDGSQLADARRIAEVSDDVEFLGRQDHDRIPGHLAGAHLVALTSYGFDNQPMTIVEAVTAGRGVLYCDPALGEGLAGPGILVPHDEEGMAAALVDVVGHPGTVLAASRATERARAEFAPETHARRMTEVYENALAELKE